MHCRSTQFRVSVIGPWWLLSCIFAAIFSGDAAAQIRFEDVSQSANISHVGVSHGASWGDFNNDGFPDIWCSNHYNVPSLYLNLANGTFQNIINLVWNGPVHDAHGAAWADFDDDGDQDILEMVGGANPNHLWVNFGDRLVDEATSLGVGSPGSRGRTPIWFDFNGDGLLDVVLTQLTGNGYFPAIMRNTGHGFVDAAPELGNTLTHSYYGQLADLTGDGRPELVLHGVNFPIRVYEIGQTAPTPLVNIEPALGFPDQGGSAVTDSVIADLTGDGRNDLFLIKQGSNKELFVANDYKIEAKLATATDEQTIRFVSSGTLTISIAAPSGKTPADFLRIGASGIQGSNFLFSLDPADPDTWGIAPHTPGVDPDLLFVGVDPTSSTWTIIHSAPGSSLASLIIWSAQPMTQVTAVDFDALPPAPWPNYYHKIDGGFEEYRVQGHVNFGMPCNSVVAGDFDNDMDLDLYLACSHPVSNAENLLLENGGDGTFTVVPEAGGAQGSTEGRSESVVEADYDEDGFLDLFLTNGNEGPFFANGPHQLFHNLGNKNHWLEIDLVGTVSNTEAIGAAVHVTAGGATQTRIQDGGMHRFSQNHKRLHFGLAGNTMVTKITIEWPSGQVSTLENVAADQILGPITEPDDVIPALPLPFFVAGGALLLAVGTKKLRAVRYAMRRI